MDEGVQRVLKGMSEAGESASSDVQSLPATQPADAASCRHEGETSTYCTRCWANLYELQRQPHEPRSPARAADDVCAAAPQGRPVSDIGSAGAGEMARDPNDATDNPEDASLWGGERLLRRAITQVRPRVWFWLSVIAAGHLLGYPVALAFIAAALEALYFLAIVWQVDCYEEEPWRLVERTFLWGALPAVILALIGEVLLGGSARFLIGHHAKWLEAGLIAPIVEEICKGAVLVTLLRRHRREFDGMLDGLLYGALVGLGFSMTENVTYFLHFHGSHLHGMIIIRGLVFGMSHACFSACFGLGLGLARDARTPAMRRWAPVGGLVAAVGLHMSQNLFAIAHTLPLRYAALGLAGCAVFVWFRLVARARALEAQWIAEELANEPALTPAEVAAIGDTNRRKAARADALAERTWGAAHARVRLYALGTELAFAKHKAKIDGALDDGPRLKDLRQRIARLKDEC